MLLNGVKMQNFEGFYFELAKIFNFPLGYGRNYNALLDLLTDLEWLNLKSYRVFVANAEMVLCDEENSALEGFLELLQRVGREWSQPVCSGELWDRPAVPFHTVFMQASTSSVPFSRLPKAKGGM